MKKLISVAAALVMVPMLLTTTPVFADSPGQLSNAPTNYKVKNVTTGGAYSQAITAACGQTVKYSTIVANSDFGGLDDVTVATNYKTGAVTVSAINSVGATTSVSGSAKVTVASGKLTYVAGTSVRFASDAVTSQALEDGTMNGDVYTVNAGKLAGSTQIFVQSQAKVTCDTPPVVVKTIQVCELSTKKVITINESDFNSAKHSKDLTKCNATVTPGTTTPTTLVKTGPSDVAAMFAAVAAVATVGYAWVLRRQNAR